MAINTACVRVVCLELCEDILHVTFHAVFRNTETSCYHLVRAAAGNNPQDLDSRSERASPST